MMMSAVHVAGWLRVGSSIIIPYLATMESGRYIALYCYEWWFSSFLTSCTTFILCGKSCIRWTWTLSVYPEGSLR